MHKISSCFRVLSVAVLVSLLLMKSPASADIGALDPPLPYGDCEPEEACKRLKPISREELEPFIDGIMATQFNSHDLAGATIAIVQDERTILLKGYGHADLESQTRVDPKTTLFRPGSISKLFTWTAVMQLVEQGRIDLDANVNTYLKQFWVPDAFDTPITMRHLLTHTPGFEDGPLVGLFLEKPEDLVPLAVYLKTKIPKRVRAPGTYISYSNYGTALAGLIVANVSGMSFDDYIEEKILNPLYMNHSTFREPLPEKLEPHMATGYRPGALPLAPGDFEYISSLAPAGSMSTSAGDMTRFMNAHLNDGWYYSPCDICMSPPILTAASTRLMREQLFTADPRLPGVAHGFWEINGPSMRTIGHGGDTIYFHSQLILVPEEKFGLFVSYNAPDGAAAAGELVRAVLDRYFTLELVVEEQPGVLEGFEGRAEKLAGLYRPNRRSFTKAEKVASFGAFAVKRSGEGLIDFKGRKNHRFQEVEPYVFEEVNGPEKIIFEVGENGTVTHLFLAGLPFIPLDRLGPLDNPNLHALVISLMMIAAVFTLYGGLRHPSRIFGSGSLSTRASLTLFLTNAVMFAFVIGFAAIMAMGLDTLIFGYPPALTQALALPVVGAVLTLLALYFVFAIWREGIWSAWKRTKYTANVALMITFLAVLNHWNLLGWHL